MAAKKKAAKKGAKKAAKKSAKKAAKKSARKPNAAFMKAVKPSAALAVVVGTTPLPRDKKVYALKGPLDGKSYSLAATAPSARSGSPNEVVRRARVEAARLSRG